MKKGLGIAAFTILLVLGVTSVVQALPPAGQGHDYMFYSDDTFTTAVGERYLECNGVPYNWGVRSAYEYAAEWDCATFESIFGGCYSGFYYCPDDFYPNDPCHCF
jgi:hypothetical protein